MSKLGIACISSAAITAGLYLVLNYTSAPQSVKWYLFGAHLLFAAVGAISGILGLCMKEWICAVGVAVCGYFLLIQLGGI
jgi:hypothetical protein